MGTVLLLGKDHAELGRVAIETLGSVAVGISRGRHPKAYPYLDPNEDTVLAVTSADRTLLVVADGHSGIEASHAAITSIASAARSSLNLSGSALIEHLLEVAQRAVGEATADLESPRDRSATALTMVTVGPEGGAAASVADCVSLYIRGGKTQLLTDVDVPFLGRDSPPVRPRIRRFSPRPGDLVVAASDGLIDFIPRPWPDHLGQLLTDGLSAEEAVAAAIAAAGEGGGGDNVAVASLRVAE